MCYFCVCQGVSEYPIDKSEIIIGLPNNLIHSVQMLRKEMRLIRNVDYQIANCCLLVTTGS